MVYLLALDQGANVASGPSPRQPVSPPAFSSAPVTSAPVPLALDSPVRQDTPPKKVFPQVAIPQDPVTHHSVIHNQVTHNQVPPDRVAQEPLPQEDTADLQLSLPMEAPDPPAASLSPVTLGLAAQDVRAVLREQNEQSQILTTKLNILFVANGALLTSLSISRLLVSGSLFSLAEILGFLISFSLLMRAFLPRQVAITPNLEDSKFLETYLALSARDYQLQMLVNLAETYNANKQRLEDISQGLKYAAYTIWGTTAIMLINIVVIYITKSLQAPML